MTMSTTPPPRRQGAGWDEFGAVVLGTVFHHHDDVFHARNPPSPLGSAKSRTSLAWRCSATKGGKIVLTARGRDLVRQVEPAVRRIRTRADPGQRVCRGIWRGPSANPGIRTAPIGTANLVFAASAAKADSIGHNPEALAIWHAAPWSNPPRAGDCNSKPPSAKPSTTRWCWNWPAAQACCTSILSPASTPAPPIDRLALVHR